ncbi:hypothetical protein [Plebeiibacterium marinum]|uniref:Uncharacterized protein n=1 Tax=Plebeiibacterium marinum TaxID=2992111 RepID=A0AAE3MFN4_9BACT|nr:hypothetical protein [Plebeiobacterium marinum]MCW3806983.1 hypothetical protein [Plebeiobacterium marinum]
MLQAEGGFCGFIGQWLFENGCWLKFKERNTFKNEVRTNTARGWVKGLFATFEVLGI